MVQWLRIRPPVQGDTCLTPGLGRFHVPWGQLAHVPQLLSLCALETMLCNEKPLQQEARALQLESSLHSLHLEKAQVYRQRPSTTKNK